MRTDGPRAADADGGQNDRADDPRLRWYPPSWRARYGDELVALLDDEYRGHLPALVRLGLVTGGLRQRARRSGLTGESAPPSVSLRAGALVVLAAWTAFVIAGASFAKFSEHFDQALPHSMGAHRVPDLAFTVLQTAAGVASLLVVVGALLAVPAFLRFLRGGGWASVRGHVLRALASAGLTVAVTVPLLVWAHHLTSHQRNNGFHWYGALFLMWAGLIVITLTLWTGAAVAAGRRVDLTSPMLTAEAILAAAVAVAMVVMASATAVWWGAIAKDAPAFLTASPAGASGSPWDIWLLSTAALMAVAVGAAAVGLAREIRVWTKMQGR
jgi:hypothetical protein